MLLLARNRLSQRLVLCQVCPQQMQQQQQQLSRIASLSTTAKGAQQGASSSTARPQTTTQKTTTRTYNSLNDRTPFQICFLRHGQSTWNRDNRFIGWTDTPLTDDGVLEARVAGQMLFQSGMRFDEVHTSLLRRSIRTTNLALMELGQEYVPVYKHWRLNERSYGDLVGKNKKEVVMQHGAEQVKLWRRSYDIPPPVMAEDHPYHPARDPRYRLVCVCVCCYNARSYLLLQVFCFERIFSRGVYLSLSVCVHRCSTKFPGRNRFTTP